jgi:VIT1/CCC1 family predicted Fe2+/Mn2+ transporter
LAAGLSGAVDNTSIIVTAGLAEIAAGSMAMGLGGYLAARSDAEHYHTERAREEAEAREKPTVEAQEVADVFRAYGLMPTEINPVVEAFRKRAEAWVDFMMRFELGIEKPEPRRALASALTIAAAYIGGGFIPFGPYMAMNTATALAGSVAITLLALAIFGYVKGHFSGASPVRSSLQTVLIGGLAAIGCRGSIRDRTGDFMTRARGSREADEGEHTGHG